MWSKERLERRRSVWRRTRRKCGLFFVLTLLSSGLAGGDEHGIVVGRYVVGQSRFADRLQGKRLCNSSICVPAAVHDRTRSKLALGSG